MLNIPVYEKQIELRSCGVARRSYGGLNGPNADDCPAVSGLLCSAFGSYADSQRDTTATAASAVATAATAASAECNSDTAPFASLECQQNLGMRSG